MNELTQQKIRFSDAARAIGVKSKVLRNWLQRNQIALISDYEGARWTEFTLGDVAILAVMQRLVHWGCGVNDANEIAVLEVFPRTKPLFAYKNTPAAAFIAQLEQWHLFVLEGEDGELDTYSVPKQEYLPLDKPDFLFLNLGLVIDRAFQRLEQSE